MGEARWLAELTCSKLKSAILCQLVRDPVSICKVKKPDHTCAMSPHNIRSNTCIKVHTHTERNRGTQREIKYFSMHLENEQIRLQRRLRS